MNIGQSRSWTHGTLTEMYKRQNNAIKMGLNIIYEVKKKMWKR
jgi:hypothetical protein